MLQGCSRTGAVYIFTGEAGCGKSTVVDLLPHKVALNDDLVVLRPDGARLAGVRHSFLESKAARRDGQTADGLVAGIIRLVQDQQDYLEPISTAVAISELTANCPTVNTDPVELPALMNRCREVAEAVKVQRLHFRKSADFWDFAARTGHRVRDLDSIPQRSPTVVSRLLDDEAVLVHPVQGKVRVLNPVGARVWELADGERTLGDIVEAIAMEFQADVALVKDDVPAFCEDLAQRGVLAFDR